MMSPQSNSWNEKKKNYQKCMDKMSQSLEGQEKVRCVYSLRKNKLIKERTNLKKSSAFNAEWKKRQTNTKETPTDNTFTSRMLSQILYRSNR